MMQKLANELGLPAPLMQALEQDTYDAGASDISVTGLISPPRIRVLRKKHREHLTEDASDVLYRLMGKIGHSILEHGNKDHIVEKRFFREHSGWTISGQADLILNPDSEGAEIWDYKFCSIYVHKDGVKPEHVQQLNLLRWLIGDQYKVTGLNICAIYRDFSKMKAARDPEHPQRQVELFRVPMWSADEMDRFLTERIAAHKAAEMELPLCTDAERWAKPEKWALMRKGQKRAVKLYDTESQANAAVANTFSSTGHYVEHRQGEQTRCEHFCQVSAYCSQFRELMNK